MIRIGIVGATGYTGTELLRLAVSHPQIQVAAVTSQSEKGKPVVDLFPHLRGHTDLVFSGIEDLADAKCDVVFFATPHGTAMAHAGSLLHAGAKVIDLSADFRMPDAALWSRWYGMPHTATELLPEAVYGLPELNREKIRKARLVANPGCYPTAIILALLPALEKKCLDTGDLIVNAVSGVSGAGRKASLDLLYAEISESFKAYNIQGHRHQPEINGVLNQIAGDPVSLTFAPHLAPMVRGIHATVHARLKIKTKLQELYEQRYAHETFVDVLPGGAHPDTRSVSGTNVCRLALQVLEDGRRVVVLSVIDNLVKGAAGQALQNMNLMCGLDESTGLDATALAP